MLLNGESRHFYIHRGNSPYRVRCNAYITLGIHLPLSEKNQNRMIYSADLALEQPDSATEITRRAPACSSQYSSRIYIMKAISIPQAGYSMCDSDKDPRALRASPARTIAHSRARPDWRSIMVSRVGEVKKMRLVDPTTRGLGLLLKCSADGCSSQKTVHFPQWKLT
ncbi:hypothetical protein IF2G_11040 [Cordyceps javanica]|nr:hypothetical protein IF2G_11040 [Cordyceps javanica]